MNRPPDDLPFTEDELAELHTAAATGDVDTISRVVDAVADRTLIGSELIETTGRSVESTKVLFDTIRSTTDIITVEFASELSRREKIGCLLSLAGMLAAEERHEHEHKHGDGQ